MLALFFGISRILDISECNPSLIDHLCTIDNHQIHHYSCQVEQLSKAMDILTFLGRKWTKGHFTEVPMFDSCRGVIRKLDK